jgi:acetolactate synthase-1/2/3 large subunit
MANDTQPTRHDGLAPPPTAASRLLQEAARLGVDCIFTNLGSDHPAFIEAFAAIDADARPHAAHHRVPARDDGVERRARARDAQPPAADGAGARRCRHAEPGLQHPQRGARPVPAIIVAGLSPVTVSGERPGARTEYIHYTQDTTRQHEIGGQYMKWSYEVRAGEMVDQVLLRAAQIANTSPEGPVYLTGSREVWEEPAGAAPQPLAHWQPIAPAVLPADGVRTLHDALWAARKPLVITSYLGRQPRAAELLAELSSRIGIAVCEVNPQAVNCPGDHPHHVGYRRNALVDEADCILLLDVDVPWIVSKVTPRADARLFHVDCDTLKAGLGFWHFPAEGRWQADSLAALEQLLALPAPTGDAGRNDRVAWITQARERLALPAAPVPPNGAIGIAQVSEAVARLVNDKTVLLYEAPTATERMLHTCACAVPAATTPTAAAAWAGASTRPSASSWPIRRPRSSPWWATAATCSACRAAPTGSARPTARRSSR